MEKHTRRVFFWLLVALFFVTVSLIIPYAMGYRFSFTKGIFVFTGSITIKSNPQDVEILVDQKPVTLKLLNRLNSTIHIDGQRPGEHLIEVRAEGFNTWRKKLLVNSGVSTEFWNVMLTKKEYPRTIFETSNITDFFYDSQKKSAAYIENKDAELLIHAVNIESATDKVILATREYQFTSNSKENIEWSPKSTEIIVPLTQNGKSEYLIIDTETNKVLKLSELAETDSLEKVRWDSEERNFIYYLSQGTLYRLNILNPAGRVVIARDIASYDLSGNRIYFLQLPSAMAYFTTPESLANPKQITASEILDMSDPSYQIIVYDEQRLAFLNKKGDFYIFNHGEKDQYFKKMASGIKEIQFSNDGKKLVFWNEWEISTYFLRDWEVQPYRFEDERRDITRSSEKISNVQWTKDYEHLLFFAGGKLKIIELDHRDQRSIMDITALSVEETKIVSDFPDNILLFIDQDESGRHLFSIPFPENTGIF